jgi:cobalt-zinc-cadmium efflux system protein
MTHGKHGCSMGHGVANTSFTSAFAIGVVLNFAFVLLEVTFGFFAHSLALIADAGHNMSDVLGLLLAWGAAALSRRGPTERRTYGWKSSSILAALFNGILLLVSVGAIAWEAVRRLHNPPDVAGKTIMWVAAIGIVINTVTALMFFSGRKHDLNIRGAFMHMAADAAVSVGVVLAGWAILVTGLRWIDPAVSLVIAAVIVWGTWSLLRDSINLALHGVPGGIEIPAVRAYLVSLPHVTAVHDLHVWPMSTTETALTAHLVRDVDDCDCALLDKAAKDLLLQFQIHHATLQFETVEHECSLASEETV